MTKIIRTRHGVNIEDDFSASTSPSWKSRAQNLLDNPSCPINNHLDLSSGGIVWRCQADMVSINSIDPSVSWHQGNRIFWFESSRMNSPGNALGWGIGLLSFFILDEFELFQVSMRTRIQLKMLGYALTAQKSPRPRISPIWG